MNMMHQQVLNLTVHEVQPCPNDLLQAHHRIVAETAAEVEAHTTRAVVAEAEVRHNKVVAEMEHHAQAHISAASSASAAAVESVRKEAVSHVEHMRQTHAVNVQQLQKETALATQQEADRRFQERYSEMTLEHQRVLTNVQQAGQAQLDQAQAQLAERENDLAALRREVMQLRAQPAAQPAQPLLQVPAIPALEFGPRIVHAETPKLEAEADQGLEKLKQEAQELKEKGHHIPVAKARALDQANVKAARASRQRDHAVGPSSRAARIGLSLIHI